MGSYALIMKRFDSLKRKAKRTYKDLKKKLQKKRNQRKLLAVAGVLMIGAVSAGLLLNNAKDNRQKLQLLHQVEVKKQESQNNAKQIETIQQEKVKTEAEKRIIEQQKVETEKQLNDSKEKIQDLEIKLQAKKQAQVKLASYQRPASRTIVTSSRFQEAGITAGNTYSPGYCTWYVKNNRPDLPNNLGNANTWFFRARAQGLATGYTPRVGAVGATKAYMHVVLITAVNGDGTVTVSEMNYKGLYIISSRVAPASEFNYIY